MARKKTQRKIKDEWNIFGLRVLDYNVDIEWGFNSAIYDRERRSDESHVYESNMYLNLSAVVLWPDEQKGDVYYISLSEPIKDWFLGPPIDFKVKLGAFPAKDRKGNQKYKKYKDGEFPLYDPPNQVGMIRKAGGQYHASANVETETLSQMINLALSDKVLYVHLRELIKPKPTGRGKNRWVTGVGLHLGEYDERDIEVEPNSPVEAI